MARKNQHCCFGFFEKKKQKSRKNDNCAITHLDKMVGEWLQTRVVDEWEEFLRNKVTWDTCSFVKSASY